MHPAIHRILGLDYAESSDSFQTTPSLQDALNNFYINGLLSSLSDSTIANYTNVFLLALNASNTQIGLVNTLGQIMTAIAPLGGAAFAERTGLYRAAILAPAVVARIGFFALAVLPFFGSGPSALMFALVFFTVRTLVVSFTSAPWTALAGKLVPMPIRARYFSARTFAINITGLAGAFLAGQVISGLGFPRGYQVMWVLSGVIGLTASVFFSRVGKEFYPQGIVAKEAAKTPGLSWRAMMRTSPAFTRYMLTACALALAVGIGGPFIQIYQARVLNFSVGQIGIIVSIEALANLITGRVYGTLFFERYGDYKVMKVLRCFTCLIPLAWIFVPNFYWGMVTALLAGSVWSGHELANFNGLLGVTPEEGRARYYAVQTFAVSICAAVGPALGGVLTDVIGYHALFAISGVLRLAAGVMFIIMVRDWNRPAPAIVSAPAG